MADNGPIGVFDSGAGGLSVLSHIRQLLPAEQLLYVADSAHAPYGSRSSAEVVLRCRRIMEFFLAQGAKALVVACNTATAAAVVELRAMYSLPIIAMEPGIKPAAEQSRSGVVGVLATEGTIESDRFISLKSRFSGQVEIITVACHGLVDSIEQAAHDPAARLQLLHEYIDPMRARGVDTLILGCTHYALIKDEIAAVAGPGVMLMDTGPAVARELKRRLQQEGLLKAGDSAAPGPLFFSSGDMKVQNGILGRYWGQPVHVEAFS